MVDPQRRSSPDSFASASISVESPASATSKLPNFLLSVRLKYVKLEYHILISNAIYLILIPILAAASAHLSTVSFDDLIQLWESLKYNIVSITVCSSLIVFLVTLYFISRPRSVYLIDFNCFRPDSERICSREIFMERSSFNGSFTDENLGFQKKILKRSGLGQNTHLPPAVMSLMFPQLS